VQYRCLAGAGGAHSPFDARGLARGARVRNSHASAQRSRHDAACHEHETTRRRERLQSARAGTHYARRPAEAHATRAAKRDKSMRPH
jgi:hypothetical protein